MTLHIWGRMQCSKRQSVSGFTLIEFMVIIAVLLIPSITFVHLLPSLPISVVSFRWPGSHADSVAVIREAVLGYQVDLLNGTAEGTLAPVASIASAQGVVKALPLIGTDTERSIALLVDGPLAPQLRVYTVSGTSITPPVSVALPAGFAQEAAVGDLNRDGRADIVVVYADYHDRVVVAYRSGGGFNVMTQSLAAISPVQTPKSHEENLLVGSPIAKAYLSKDEKISAIKEYSADAISTSASTPMQAEMVRSDVWLRDGEAFNQTGLRAAAVGDFNGDGWSDIAVAGGDPFISCFLQLALGSSSGFIVQPRVMLNQGLCAVALRASRLNEDLTDDLAIASDFNGGQVLVGFGTSSGNLELSSVVNVGGEPVSLSVGDLDGDGSRELVVATQGNASMYGTPFVAVISNFVRQAAGYSLRMSTVPAGVNGAYVMDATALQLAGSSRIVSLTSEFGQPERHAANVISFRSYVP